MSISIDVPFIPSTGALPQVSPTDYISALKSEAALPLIIRKKLSSIVQDYYKLSPELVKKDNQMKIMYKYNQKLLQTIQCFIPHEKKIIQRYNGLMKLYLTSMKKYLTTLNWKVDFIENYPPIQSHFDNFSTKDWTFVIEEDPQYTVLKPYEQMLLDTIKRFFLVDTGTLMKQLEGYISSNPATEDKQKIAAIEEIKQRIKELDKDTVTTNNMFDMLQKRKEIELDIRDLNQQYFCQFIQKDKNFIDEIARIHTRLLTTNPKELKNYLQIESDVWRGLKKKSREYRKVLEEYCEKIQSENNDIKEELQGLHTMYTKVENERNEFSSKLQYMQLKQGSSTKKDKTGNNTSIIEDSIKVSDIGGSNGMKEANKKLELRINELETEIKQMKVQIEEKEQAHRNLNVKKELMNSNTQMEELRLKLCSKLMELGIEDTAAMTSGEMFDRILQNVGAVRHYQKNNNNNVSDYIDIKITDSIAMENVRKTPERIRESTSTIKEEIMQESEKMSPKKKSNKGSRQYIRDMPLVEQIDILEDHSVEKQQISRKFKEQKSQLQFKKQEPKYEESSSGRSRQRQKQFKQFDSRRQQKGSETLREKDDTNASRQGEQTQLSKKNASSREDIYQSSKLKEEEERRMVMQSERLEKVVGKQVKQSRELRESAPVADESRLKKKNTLQMLPHSDLLSISERKSVDEESKMNDISKTAKQLSINNEKGSMLIKEDIDYLKNINRLKEQNYILSKQIIDLKDQIRRLSQKLNDKDKELQKIPKMPKSLLSSLDIEGKINNVEHTHQIENLCQSLAKELCKFDGNDFERMVNNMQSAIKNIKSSSSQNPISDKANIHQIPVLSKMLADQDQNLFKSETLMLGLLGGKLNREEDSKVKKGRYSTYLDKSDRLSLKSGEVKFQIKYQKSICFGNKDPHQPQSSSQLIGYPRTVAAGTEKSNNEKEEDSDVKMDQDEMIDMVNNFEGMSRKKEKAKDRQNISDHSLKLSQSNIKNQFSIKESELREIKEDIKPSDRKLMHDLDYLKRLEEKLEQIRNQYDAGNDLYWFHRKYKQTLQALQRTEAVVRAHEKRRENCTNKLKAGDSSLSRHKLEENIYFLQQKVNTLESQLDNHRSQFENQMASDFQQIEELKSKALADIVQGIFKNYVNVP